MISVRELPPLRHHIEAEGPSGRRFRWAADEPDPANIPSGIRHSSTMPGGYQSFDATLPRETGIDYSDLKRLSTLRVRDAAAEIVSETRLERAPRVSGDQIAISPSAVGWQAHLDDDKSASLIGIDRTLDRWQGPSRARIVDLIASSLGNQQFEIRPDPAAGQPCLSTVIHGAWIAASAAISEAWYDAGSGNAIGRLRATWTKGAQIGLPDANWHWLAYLISADLVGSDTPGELRAAGPGTIDVIATATRRYAVLELFYGNVAGGADNSFFNIDWTNLRVFGNHGLTIRGGTPDTEGLLASDVIAYGLARWAPLLKFVVGETIIPSIFIIPQFAFPDATTMGEMLKQATRFGLQDWAVWAGPTFWWHDRGMFARNWRARIAPAKLEETGPQIDRVWESVLVQYQDVDGTTRTVGPPGSGADTEDVQLKDTDPENPANELNIIRRDLLVMGTGTAASAIEIGRRFLEQTKLLDSSGQAQIIGHIEDDRGILHPYSHVRAGDTITFVDAADTSPRRIVRAEHTEDQRSCAVDLDAPPDALAAILERLGVVLVPLGLS